MFFSNRRRPGLQSARLLAITAFFAITAASGYAQVDSSAARVNWRFPEQALPGGKLAQHTNYFRFAFDSSLSSIPAPDFPVDVEIDTTGKRIFFKQYTPTGELAGTPLALTMLQYMQRRLVEDQRYGFYTSAQSAMKQTQVGSGGALVLKVPWEIKSKTFQRIFGSGSVQLKVTGNISFSLSGQLESREGSQVSALQQQDQFRPKFEQQQRFNIEGRIGDKVRIEVQQNSQATFDLENNLKVTYTGYEEEILQKLEAGNIDLSLPRTRYVSFSGKNKGLFGLKAMLKFGNLDVTAIASLERGEKQKISKSGGEGTSSETVIYDYNYINNTFFFVSEQFRSEWNVYSDDRTIRGNDNNIIRNLRVYMSLRTGEEGGREAWAFYSTDTPGYDNPADLDQSQDAILGEREFGKFKELTQGTDYEYYQEWGVIRLLSSSVNNDQILAVAYDLQPSGAQSFGDIDDEIEKLMLIKPRNMTASEVYFGKTWDLMMRNVYRLGASDISPEALRVSIRLYNDNNNPTDETSGRTFLNLMGLDIFNNADQYVERGDNNPDVNNANVYRLADGFLFFPALQPFYPLPSDSDFDFNPDLYIRDAADTTINLYSLPPNSRTDLINMSKFQIAVQTGKKTVQTEFDLGFNVLAGSETVRLNNVVLERDKDYLIDYFSGQLSITNPAAQRENADIDIEYERGAIFQLDKKTLFGMNAIYHINENSFIGFTGMFLDKTTIEQRVRVGQEPYMNFVWDVNTALNFKPRFVTRWLNYLPLIESKAPSTISIEAEYAQVLPNPNTQNNGGTGDNDGVAYVDDFEGSRRASTLGIQYQGWVPSSVPARIDDETIESSDQILTYDSYKPKYVWFNPYDRVPIEAIWPERADIGNANADQRTDVLDLAWQQRPENEADWDKAWLGLMRSTQTFSDQSETKYIEIWVYISDSLRQQKSKLNIDIGAVSEDFYVRYGRDRLGGASLFGLNSEDINSNQLLDEGEDIGLDGLADGTDPDEDPEDNWDVAPLQNRSRFPFGVNGTEGNGQAQGGRYPDTEDLNSDDVLNTDNSYFTYEVILDPRDPRSSEFYSADNGNGWYQLRIPLKDYNQVIGSPNLDFRQITSFRMWVEDLPQDTVVHTLRFATIDFVANEWNELGIAASDTTAPSIDEDRFNILVYNTDEHSNNIFPGAANYVPPPGVEGVVDPVTQVRAREQSLVFRFIDLPAGHSVIGRKNIYEAMNFSNYKRIRMFIHGDHRLELLSAGEQGRQLEFILRIGKDQNNFYEYHLPLYPRWDEIEKRNYLDIDIPTLSQASFETEKIFADPEKPGAWFIARGNPTIRGVRYITFAVKNSSPDPNNRYSGEVWFDELRLSEVDKTPGSAMRLNTTVKGADVFSVTANFETKDANFHTINEQNASGFQSGSLNFTQSQSVSTNLNFDRLMWEDTDFRIPITAKYTASKSIPKFVQQSDKPSGYEVENMEDRLQALFGVNKLDPEVDEISAVKQSRSIGAKISRQAKNPGWLTDLTIDQLTLDIDLVESTNRDYRTQFNDQFTYRNAVSYKIPWGRENYIRPLFWARDWPLLSVGSGLKIYYTPAQTSVNGNISHSVKETKLRNQTEAPEPVQNTTTSRGYRFEYKITDNLTFNTNRSWNAKVDHLGWSLEELYQNIFSDFNFGESTNIKQSAQLALAPDLSRYFKIGWSASSSYDYRVKLTTPRENTGGNGLSQKYSFSFKPNQLVRLIYNPDAGGSDNRGRADDSKRRGRTRGRGSKRPTVDDEDKEADSDDSEEEKGFDYSVLNPALWIFHAFDSWSNLSLNYTKTNNSTYGFLAGQPSIAYQFGLEREATQLDSFPGRSILLPVFKDADNFSASFGIDIARNVTSSIDYKLSESRTFGVTAPREDRSESVLALLSSPEAGDGSAISFPNWSFSVSGLEKLPLVKEIANKVSINHARSGDKKNTRVTRSEGNPSNDRTTTNNFSPLLGFKFNFVNDISLDARYNVSQSYISQANDQNRSWSQSSDISVTVNYRTSGGFRIPIPLFGIDQTRIENQMDFSLTFASGDRTYQTFDTAGGGANPSWVEREKTSNWSVKPAVNFALSKRVRGSVFYEQKQDENKISGKTSIMSFGINVNIEIRE
jgi:hypothetical protein